MDKTLIYIVAILISIGLGYLIASAILLIFELRGMRTRPQSKTVKRLYNSLRSIIDQIGIPVTLHEDLGTAAGKFIYETNGRGELFFDNSEIKVLNKWDNDPWLLAHEIGHFFALKNGLPNTEQEADRQGLMICKSILTPKEQKELAVSLKVFFEDQIK